MIKAGKKEIRVNFFSGIREEFKKVEWPSKKETIELTTTVVILSLIVAVFVGIIDFSLARLLEILAR